MKSNLSTILLLFLASLTFAQEATLEPTATFTSLDSSIEDSKRNAETTIKTAHSQLAGQQLSSFLSHHLKYSDQLRRRCLEGKVVVEIKLSKTGAITETQIIDGSCKLLNRQVLKYLKKFQTLDIKDGIYLGAHKLQIPITFSIR